MSGDMEFLEVEGPGGDDSDDQDINDDSKHSSLLQAMSSLDGKKRLAEVQRTEPAREISEFNLGSGGKVRLNDLVKVLDKTTNQGHLKKSLNRLKKNSHVLAPTKSTLEQNRIEREVAYEEKKKEVTKWEPVVFQNRVVDHITFPLEKPDVSVKPAAKLAKRFAVYTPLEKEVAELLHGTTSVTTMKKALTKAEKAAVNAMDLEMARERRAELQKYRVMLSYTAAKAHRQKKIKSKKFHRVMRKEKQKHEQKAMEELKKKDPDGFEDAMNQVDKNRVQERFSLSHKNASSKFMKRQTQFAKYNDNARQAVQDMVQTSHDLRQKVRRQEESSDEEEYVEPTLEDVADVTTTTTVENPWMAPAGKPAQGRELEMASSVVVGSSMVDLVAGDSREEDDNDDAEDEESTGENPEQSEINEIFDKVLDKSGPKERESKTPSKSSIIKKKKVPTATLR